MARVTADAEGWTTYGPPADQIVTEQLAGALEAAVHDCRLFARLAREAKLEGLPQTLHLTWAQFCEERLHQPPEIVDAIVIGLEVIGEDVPVPAEVAERVGRGVQAKMRAAAEQTKKGQVRPEGRPLKTAQITQLSQGARAEQIGISRRTQQLLDELARKSPMILDAYRAGKYRSVRAARKAAGLIHEKTPLDQLRHWWRKADAVAQQTFRLEIGKDGAA